MLLQVLHLSTYIVGAVALGLVLLPLCFPGVKRWAPQTESRRNRARDRESQLESNLLFIDCLPVDCTDVQLRALLAPFGIVVASAVARRPNTAYFPFGFVAMQHAADAAAARRKLHGTVIDRLPIRVDSCLSPAFGWSIDHASRSVAGQLHASLHDNGKQTVPN
jgi:RNA recognition motif-containing protein